MNETVRDYCTAAGIEFTRCRPYRKNDQAWVEQKNGAVVRRTVGYRRFEGLEAAAVLARLYAAMRLFVNFFQPSFKLAEKAREGAKVRKRYHPPATPVSAADGGSADVGRGATPSGSAAGDAWTRFACCRRFGQRSSSLSRSPMRPESVSGDRPRRRWSSSSAGLRTAWQDGEVRPTSTTEGRRPSGCGGVPIRSRR